MIENFIIKSLIGLISFGFFGIFFYQKGKKDEKNKQIRDTIDEARKSNYRAINRRNDNITVIRDRMQKSVRK